MLHSKIETICRAARPRGCVWAPTVQKVISDISLELKKVIIPAVYSREKGEALFAFSNLTFQNR